jgi:hypothetical protein
VQQNREEKTRKHELELIRGALKLKKKRKQKLAFAFLLLIF